MKTKHSEIINYWSQIEDECGLSVDWAEADKLCWRCANETKLDRCHIIPKSLNGTDHPSNLVLLCSKCHKEGPNVSDPKFMWLWLRKHAVPFYGTYWQERGVKEFEFLFGRRPLSTVNAAKISSVLIETVMKNHIAEISTHFGEGGLNSSTVAWVLYQVEQELIIKEQQ